MVIVYSIYKWSTFKYCNTDMYVDESTMRISGKIVDKFGFSKFQSQFWCLEIFLQAELRNCLDIILQFKKQVCA
jgi:hypothetical protein